MYKPIPERINTEVFDSAAKCNSAIRREIETWVKANGFKSLYLHNYHRQNGQNWELIRIMPNSGFTTTIRKNFDSTAISWLK